ncbi:MULTISPECIES: response regulator FixJ [Caulobacter]|jgi:two-component system response regulator FixJ|uniref:Two component transcriptional regulator, LuxR family n=1 Tax=Caulobacter vibrioides OR37 TaxID=1292034 RepID=R0E8G6_CAUVI|nr:MULTISPECIES: response regulator FixJ [Caulobacter]ENZ81773.1 two component transcriptional regulator, LuxR family [Caulobacter vibrioides OR37]MBQ1560200.1 response regulator transcription factor FixJ [Caulobacter sp.]
MSDAPQVVHVVDDDESARESLAFLLESADFEVESYASAPAFLDALPTAKPGVIITDVRMPEMSGQDLVARLSALKVRMPIVMITGHGDIPMAVEAMRSGVADFLEKPFSESRMLDALRRAFDLVEAPSAVSDDQAAIHKRIETLSERERQVLDGVVAGHANKVIARDLGISPRTVEIYRAKLMTKMQADNLAALVRMTLSARG